MDANLRNRVRHRLSALQSDNGETLFEQVSAEIARRRIHANIKMSAFVAGHGDKGRDFENVPGHLSGLIGPRGNEDELRPADSVVGACTLGRTDPPTKIRTDVTTIQAKGPRPDFIYYFCETDFPSTTQVELRDWCKRTYGIRLHIVTGNTLADWLSEPDLAGALDLLQVEGVPVPRCILPAVDTEGFVGRGPELERMARSLIDGDAPAGGRLMGLYGSPGVGKSGLAVHFARSNRYRFPDGIVGVDLRGVDDPMDALARLSIAFGQPLTADDQGLPPHQIAQDRFAHRRCLILLDNLEHGSSLKQIRPGGRAAVLITCRDQDVLAKFAVPADQRLPIKRLPRAESIAYLQAALGGRTHLPNELDALAEALSDLPLALRIGVRRVLEDPIIQGRIGRFLTRLLHPARLGELAVAGEDDLDLMRLLDLSLEPLTEAQRRAFARLSVCNTEDFGVRAASGAMDDDNPMSLLARLARLSLLEVDQQSRRFRFHALVDDYSRHLADRWGLMQQARASHAEAMAKLLRDNADADGQALDELLMDREDIRRGMEHYAESGRIDLPLLQGLTRLVEQTALGEWHSTLLARMRDRLDPSSRTWLNAVLLLQQGKRALAMGRLEEARGAFERSLEIQHTLHDQRGEAMVLNSLGGVLRDLGRLEEARGACKRSLEIERTLQDQRGEAMVLNSLGGVLRDLGRLEDAREACERSLEIGRTLHDQRGEAMALNNLGWLHRELGQPEHALEVLGAYRSICKDLGLRPPDFFADELKKLRKWSRQLAAGTHTLAAYHQAMAQRRASSGDWHGAIIHDRRNLALDADGADLHKRRENLAHASFRAKRPAEAVDMYDQTREAGPLSPLSCASLGRALHLSGGDLTEAETQLRRACDVQDDNAWAHSWLALVLADVGRLDEAELHARRALVGKERHAVLLHNLGQVLARHPDSRGDKLAEALDNCERAANAAAESDMPFEYPQILAAELRRRLGPTDGSTTETSAGSGCGVSRAISSPGK